MTTENQNDVLTANQEQDSVSNVNETNSDNSLDMLMEVGMKVTVELGRTKMKVRDLLNLSSGSIVELEKQAGEPVDILVNGTMMAQAEVVVVEDRFAVRITKMLNRIDRKRKIL
ncbi:MAG: flagellar motor switch protein FliN [bacterium]|nr:flagellar motor switch protein FliN [bacterium]MCP4799171.1 flagellar motor switch protein FliN [bacterium]